MKSFEIHRNFFIPISMLQIFISIEVSETKEVDCEIVHDLIWPLSVKNVKTCYMDNTASIDEHGVAISTRDETVEGLDFS